MFKLVIIGLVVTVLGLFAMTKIDPNVKNTNVNGGDNTIKNGEKKVIITGQILYPGEYILSPTDTIQTLIDKAGGLLSDADPLAFTATMQIGNYTEFYIPPVSKTPDTCLVENIKKSNINNAGLDELKSIGLSASQSQALIDYRNEKGNFNCIEDVQLVTGIGPKTFLNIRDYITIK